MKLAYRPDIDGLRAIAVLAVLFFHTEVPGFGGGFVGVDIFFVISGFLITSILVNDIKEDNYSIARFYERRIRRIFPALFPVLPLYRDEAHLSNFGSHYVSTIFDDRLKQMALN